MSNEISQIKFDEFQTKSLIGYGPFSQTSLVILNNSNNQFAQKLININLDEESISKFNDLCNQLARKEYPCSILPTHMSLPDDSNNIPPALFTQYFENKTLKELIQSLEGKKEIPQFDSTQRFIILYGILLYLDAIHKDDLIHGRLKLSNVLLDSSYEAFVADQFLYQLNNNDILNNANSRMIDYIVSIPPEVYNKNTYTAKSDIYSFGIILLQILLKKINVYSDLTKKPSDILRFKQDGKVPNLSDIQNETLKNAIKKCLDFDPGERPSAAELIKIFDDISSDEDLYNVERLNNFKSKNQLTMKINYKSEKLIEVNKKADNNDSLMMYEYGIARLFGEECTKSIKEGMKYIKKAADSGLEKAKLIMNRNDISNPEDEVKSDEITLSNAVTLMNDNFFKREKFLFSEKIDMDQLINDNTIISVFGDVPLKKKGFAFTENTIQKMSKIYNYVDIGVPVLIVGPTASSKTISVEVLCELKGRKLVKINCCSENDSFYMLGGISGNPNSSTGMSISTSPFIDAYQNGHTVLLDQIDLANQQCMQFIAKALDSKIISIEMPGKSFEEIKMHDNFRLIATMNSSDGHYINKRQHLDTKFISRFQVVNFSSPDKSEYKEIANNLCSSFDYKPSNRLIKDLINFHIEWCSRDDVNNDIMPFTVREICSTINAIANKKNLYDTIMTVYGARYPNKEKLVLRSLFQSKNTFKKLKSSKSNYPPCFPPCFKNKNLENTVKSMIFSLENNQNVLLIGKKGSGITQVARWVARCYDKQNSPKIENNDDDDSGLDQPEFFLACTCALKCSDLIGYQEFADPNDFSHEPITWKPGFILKAIENGKCAVLDRINEVHPMIAERLNPIIDENHSDEPKTIYIPENPNNPTITVNPNFRMICTCHEDEIEQMSPAFINRFNIIYLENQLEQIKDHELKGLIYFLIKNDSLFNFLDADNSNLEEIEESENEPNSDSNDINDNNEDETSTEYDDEEEESHSEEKKNDDDDDEKDDLDEAKKEFKASKNEDPTQSTNEQNPADEENINDTVVNEPNSFAIVENENDEYEPSNNLIDSIYNIIYDHIPSISILSQLCKSVRRLIQFFSNDEKQLPSEITEEMIVKYANDLIMISEDSENIINVPQQIEDYIINLLDTFNLNNGYSYKEWPVLRSFISKLFTYSIINIPVCVKGQSGIGKTFAIKTVADMRTNFSKTRIPYRLNSYHSEISPNYLYSCKKEINGKSVFVKEDLTNSMENGWTFIADNMHLLDENVIKSLYIAFEPYIESNTYLPGMNAPIKIHPYFTFIGCQNDNESFPLSSISSWAKILYYPIQSDEEKRSICLLITNRIYGNYGNRSISPEHAMKIERYMAELNKLNIVPKWTFHDVEKIIRRVYYQDKNPDRFHRVDLLYNILFYTLSSNDGKDIDSILDQVCDIIGNVYSLSSDHKYKLKRCYKSQPRIENNPKNSGKSDLFIMKDDIGISTENIICFNNHRNEFSSLPTLLDSIFKILISDSCEPILLSGPAGYKTFLSQLFIENPRIIHLSQESSFQNFLGIQTYFNLSEVKEFYLDLICKIYHIGKDQFNNLKQKLNSKQLNRSDITPNSNSINYILNENTIHHLLDKLFSDKIEHCNQSILSDYSVEFKPGPILESIIEGKSLILKNASNISPAFLNRINEFLSEKQNFTLKEDYSHTFTTNEQAQIINPNSHFRIFAIYSSDKERKISDEVTSKFTVINIPSYNENELVNVLKSYRMLYQKHFSDEMIQKVINFSQIYKKYIKKTLLLSQIINILETYFRNNPVPSLYSFGIIIYRIVFGMISERKDYIEIIKTIYSEADIPVPCFIGEMLRYENPLNVSSNCISKISNISFNCPDGKVAQLKVEFTPSFINTIDIIHLGLSSTVPVIFEGKPGQGKGKAIELIAQQLGYEIINIVISKSTNVDDLFGKFSLDVRNAQNIQFNKKLTRLSKAIRDSINTINKRIFVFHNLNHASPDVIEKISTLFDRNEKEFLLPDGFCTKGKMNLIGIINNSKKDIFDREKLPTPLLYSSIYYIVDDFRMQDVLNVTLSLFNSLFDQHDNSDFKNEAVDFYEKYEAINKVILETNASPALTISDISKYIKLRKETYSSINRKFLYMVIFGYRFYQQEVIDKALAKIKLSDKNFLPVFEFDDNKKEVYFKESKCSKGICLKMKTYSSSVIEQAKIDLKSLTISQQKCMLFLACSVLSKQTCIIQGKTGSGKTHVIRLFAKILGQKLNIYQMNDISDLSILTGKPKLFNEITSDDERQIRSEFNGFREYNEIKAFIDENFSCQPREWKLANFNKLFEKIEEYVTQHELSPEIKNNIQVIMTRIKKILSPVRKYQKENSNFINAMENGEWVLIDGIESASPEIAQKLASLCGENPEINLFELDENCFFSKNRPHSRKIHDNFHLFITNNTSFRIESRSIHPQLLDKCILFTIPSIDSSLKSTAQFLAGSFMKLPIHDQIKYDFATNLAERLAVVDQYIKTQRRNKSESFSEIQQFTGLNLTYVVKEFYKNSIENINEIINRVLHLYYLNSYINEAKTKKFLEKTISRLQHNTLQKKFIFNIRDVNPKEKYEYLFSILRNIQLYANGGIENYDFKLKDFMESCSIIQPIDVDLFVSHLQETAKIIIEKCSIENKTNLTLLENDYSQIHILCAQFVSLLDGIKKVDSKYFVLSFINDNIDLTSIKYIANHISRINLLYQLSKANRICKTNPYLLYDDQLFNFLKKIDTMSYTPTLNLFNEIISELNAKKELIPLIDDIFPYQLFKENLFHLILYWMPQFRQLYEKRITFHIKIGNNRYDFKFDEYNSFEILYIFNEEGSLNISLGSKVYDPWNKKKNEYKSYGISKYSKDKNDIKSLYFYLIVNRYINDQSQSILELKENVELNERRIPNPPEKSSYYPSISQLYSGEVNYPLISKALAIVYDFSSEKIQFLSKILNPIEANLINVASYFYSNINNIPINDILNFVEKLSIVGNQKSILWRKLNNQYEYPSFNDIEKVKKEIKIIDKEISSLENVPKLDMISDMWKAQKYIDVLELLKSPLVSLVDCDEKNDELIDNDNPEIIKEDEKAEEKDRIERVIKKMEKTNEATPYHKPQYDDHPLNVNSYKPDENVDKENYPINPLINQSSIFGQPFIKSASELDLPWSTMSMNILIDCSENINKENKIYNMMIICGLTEAVTTLGIPYSVSVIGDVGFTRTIKQFSEPHSSDSLQKICDCYLIKRNRPDLPGCLQCAIDQMRYPDETRENRMIVTFTDGLDENLITCKQWSDIFKPQNISFGFVFIKSPELSGEKSEFLEKVWNDFENESKAKNPAIQVAKIFDSNNKSFKNSDVSGNISSLTNLFGTVLKGNSRTDEDIIEIDQTYKKPIFNIDAKLDSISKCHQYLNKNYNNLRNIYVNKPDVLTNAPTEMGKLNRRFYRNKLNRVLQSKIDDSLSNDYHEFVSDILKDKEENVDESSNDIHADTNTNSYQYEFDSSDDSQYYIKDSGLPEQNNNTNVQTIYDIDNESICNKGSTVIIDSSYSCLNNLSAPHSFQTIKNILTFLKNNDLPFFNLIVATDSSPIVLCSGVKTLKALNQESRLWGSLFSILQNTTPSIKRADLGSAIHTALDLQRMRKHQNESSLFIITDGLYQKRERPRIIENINNCVQLKMRTYGVGIGIYPKGIDKLFPQVIYAQNPSNVMRGVSMLNKNVNADSSQQMASINVVYNPVKVERAINRVKKEKKPVFSQLKNDLEKIATPIVSHRDFMNIENPEDKQKNSNPTGENKELLIENYLETQKILIVNLCPDEKFDIKYLSENKTSSRKECVKEAVKYFGISIEIVQNYEDAINEITKSTSEFCDYYAVWVISGYHPEKLPPNQRSTNVYLVEQFIDVLIQFWENGGSLVFWASKDPYTFHVNAFLKRVIFKNELRCPTGKVNFQIHGDHNGQQILTGDDTGELNGNQKFNRKPLVFNDIERSSISNNLFKLYEGSEKSFVENVSVNDKNKISPFIPFEVDSNGGITSLFYASNTENKNGDIVIDCCFDKLTNDITTEGTYRYIQNIAGWTARPEVHKRLNEGSPSQWRPNAVHHDIINITESNYGDDINNLIQKADEFAEERSLKKLVRENKGDADCWLRFTIKWNDENGYHDRNDLDAHCKEPGGVEISYSNKTSSHTGGQLDIDITGPTYGVPAVENIRWKDLSRMENGTYNLFVHQYSYRGGDKGFRAVVEFTNKDNISQFSYDYPQSLPQGSHVNVADVDYRNNKFTITHKLTPIRSEQVKLDENIVSKSLSSRILCEIDQNNDFIGIINYLQRHSTKEDFFITASSYVGDHEPKNALLFNDHTKYFQSENSSNSYIYIDFQMHLVIPTGYEIRTIANGSSGNCFPRKLRIEGSNNNSNWEQLQQSDCSNLNGPNKVCKFTMSNNKEYRFIRLTQIGENFNNNHTFELDSFEIYGTLIQHLDRFS